MGMADRLNADFPDKPSFAGAASQGLQEDLVPIRADIDALKNEINNLKNQIQTLNSRLSSLGV